MLEPFRRDYKPIKKPKPRALEKKESDRDWQKVDLEESRKVKVRSRGQCEVRVDGFRCTRRAFEVHHHIGGWKLRGRGESALAKNKTHACTKCHQEITANLLEHLAGTRYRRIG